MEMNVYIGAHRTAAEHVRRIAQLNAPMLKEQGIAVIPTDVSRAAGRSAGAALQDGKSVEEVRDQYFKDLSQGKSGIKRGVIIDSNQCGSLTRPTGGSIIYPRVRFAAKRMCDILGSQTFRLFFAVRNPATFLPSCYSEAMINAHVVTFDEFVKDTNVESIRWSDCIDRLNSSLFDKETKKPHSNVFVWRHEDYKYIWRDVFYAMTGVENPQDLKGTSEPLNRGLSLYGSRLMYKYLQKHEPKEQGDFKKIREAFLEKFPSDEDAAEDDLWTNELIENLTYAYDDDWYFIERQENVVPLQRRRLY